MKSTRDIFICSSCHGIYPSAVADANMNCFDCNEISRKAHEHIFGKPICVLTSNSTKTERHYEEAGSVGEEMKLHQEKMR